MALMLEDKKAIVAELAEIASQATAVVASDYRGLCGQDITQLRAQARHQGVHLQIVRNTLAKRVFVGTQFECMNDELVGPIILAFSREEPGAAARLLRDFAKQNETVKVKVLSLDGQLLAASELQAVASLPTRDEAIAKLMSVMLAPVGKLVRTLAEPHTKLVRTFAALRDKKQNEQQ